MDNLKGLMNFNADKFEKSLTPYETEIFRPYMISYHGNISKIVQLREQITKLGEKPCQ